jgi:hypothetical protein
MMRGWKRAAVAALLFEIALFAITIPIYIFAGLEAFLPYVPAVVFIIGMPFGYWAALPAEHGALRQGTIVGLVATAIYFALVLGQYGSVKPAVDAYGTFSFVLVNVLKVAGCIVGAWWCSRRPVPRS